MEKVDQSNNVQVGVDTLLDHSKETAQQPIPQRLGQYELLEKIGEGGMGAVYRARHTKLQREVAIKIIKGGNRDLIQRFHREMAAAGQFDAPNVVRTTDAGEVDGIYYLVMELIDGKPLDRLIPESAGMPITEASELVRQAALGLVELNALGMTHRDLKPSNLMLDRTGQVKILDLGLAKFVQDGEARLTRDVVMGTLDFIAPEQAANSANVDIRGDLYSLGATLYFLLTGRTPLGPRSSLLERLTAIANDSPPPIQTLRNDIPKPLADLIHTLLAKDPARRIQTPRELVDLLAPFSKGAKLDLLLKNELPTVLAKGSALPPRKSSWSRALAGAAFLGLVAILGIVLKLQTQDGEILIEVDQPGASVFVDDEQELVVTSAEKKVYRISAAPGMRKLKVALPDGTNILSEEVEVSAGKESELFHATFLPKPEKPSLEEKKASNLDKIKVASPKAINPKMITVAQDETGDFRTITEALAAVEAGGTIRILDAGEYREKISLSSTLRHKGVTIESPLHATIVGTNPGNLVYVVVPGVTIRGLTLRTEVFPVILCTVGLNASGSIIEDLSLQGNPTELVQGVSLEALSSPDPSQPVQIRRCTIRSCPVGIRVSGIAEDYQTPIACSNVFLLDNLLVGNPVSIRIVGDVRNLVIAGNRIADSSVFGIQLEQMRGTPGNIWVVNNSIIACRFGFRIWDKSLSEADVHILNNLTLKSLSLDWAFLNSGGTPDNVQGPGDVSLVHKQWKIRGNWRSGSPPAETDPFRLAWIPPSPHDQLKSEITLLSEDPENPDFLRPAVDSPLATAADREGQSESPPFVGGVPPDRKPYRWDQLAEKISRRP